MENKQLITAINNTAKEYFNFVSKLISHTTYLSINFVEKEKIIHTKHNNYNNWGETFYNLKMYNDCTVFELTKTLYKKEDKNDMTLFWNDVIHTPESFIVNNERHKNNIYNGITLVIKLDSEHLILLNICSSSVPTEEEFHAAVTAKKLQIIEKYKYLIDYKN